MAMSSSFILSSLFIIALLASFCANAASNSVDQSFLQCFSTHINNSKPISEVLLTRNSSIYYSVLQSSIRNLRFFNNSTKNPECIITPLEESHIQATILCAKESDMQVRVRSGGHDYEGLSYLSGEKFVLIDLANMRSINVDIENESAWIEAGANLGEFYYKIAKKSNIHGFPAGAFPTVGVAGHFSGGGYGTMFQKYGLVADSITDAKIVDVNGRILDRKSMGEDLFWAIRGGGGASFGIILSWKARLVSVPETVTVFKVSRTLEQGASKLLQKWQTIGYNLDKDLFLLVGLEVVNNGSSIKNRTIRVTFNSLFLGEAKELVSLMENKFPELSIMQENCTEMSWIQSVLYFAGFSTRGSIDVLLNRTSQFNGFMKAKSDYVKKLISEIALSGLYKRLLEVETSILILTPYGGIMSEISESISFSS